MFGCLIGAQFNMKAMLLVLDPNPDDVIVPPENAGSWVTKQDPDTGEIIKVWVPADVDPNTPAVEVEYIPCEVRPLARVTGYERFNANGEYMAAGFLKMKYSPKYTVTLRDQITNITDSTGKMLYKEENFNDAPTVYNVISVDHIVDPFGVHVESIAVLERAEVQ